MQVAIVGNGPTANGKGNEIDAADFVVRLKAFWAHGPVDAGRHLDALCWYGGMNGWDTAPTLPDCEHWITQEP